MPAKNVKDFRRKRGALRLRTFREFLCSLSVLRVFAICDFRSLRFANFAICEFRDFDLARKYFPVRIGATDMQKGTPLHIPTFVRSLVML